jgi:hypothetical protein
VIPLRSASGDGLVELPDDLPQIFAAHRSVFEANPDVNGARLYAETEHLAVKSR